MKTSTCFLCRLFFFFFFLHFVLLLVFCRLFFISLCFSKLFLNHTIKQSLIILIVSAFFVIFFPFVFGVQWIITTCYSYQCKWCGQKSGCNAVCELCIHITCKFDCYIHEYLNILVSNFSRDLLKDVPNLLNDVPRVPKSIPRWRTTFNDFPKVLKGSNGPQEGI